ncbi:sugar kinase [Arthrobacter rhombi]|uniref:sugar kinase n=1 Tax=Arthrobacter rhombi TaxID=71253 RepID=UPI0031DDDE24
MTWAPHVRPLGQTLDVVGVGEAMLLLQAPPPQELSSAEALEVHVAGAEFNTCAAVARFGGNTALLTRVGDDPPGRRILSEMSNMGISTNLCAVDPVNPSGIFLRETPMDGSRKVTYYRKGSAASQMTESDAHRLSELPTPRALLLSGLTAALGRGPRRLLEQLAHEAANKNIAVIVDANLRPGLGNLDETLQMLHSVLPLTDLLVLGDDESEALFDSSDPTLVLASADQAGVGETVLKGGSRGCWYLDEDGVLAHQGPLAEAIVDTVGAGDAFLGGYIAGRLSGANRKLSVELGSRTAGAVIAAPGDTCGLPAVSEAKSLIRKIVPLDAQRL